MDIRQYLDSTYLKTAEQAGLTEAQNLEVVKSVVREAVSEGFISVMVRPEMVNVAKSIIDEAGSPVKTGTVIDFPKGTSSPEAKISEARKAIQDGAEDLDFVLDYEGFKSGNADKVKKEVFEGTALVLAAGKTVKWIIEVAALDDAQVVQLCALIKNVVMDNFEAADYDRVFVKSSTGFYETRDGHPNGATIERIKLMLENAFPLPVKAAGGVRTYDEAVAMIELGVKRIGTSSARVIADGGASGLNY